MNEPKKNNSAKKLNRNTRDSVFGGVCAGLADYFGKSVILMRFILCISVLFFLSGFIIYAILWIVISAQKNTNEDNNLNANPTTLNAMLRIFKNLFLLMLFIILGGYLGFAVGGLTGSTGNGGVANFNGAVIGIFLGLVIFIIIVSKKKKEIR